VNLHAFDPGKSLGWACWGPGSSAPEARTIDVSASNEGHTYHKTRIRVLEVLDTGDRVAIEGAVMPMGQSIESRLVLYGIRAIILQVCCELGIRPLELPPQTWRSRYLGVTQAPRSVPKTKRRQWIKERAVTEARRRGWGDVGPDAAEALGMVHCLRAEIEPSYRDSETLFAGM
jgi:hypothetical protein